MQLKNKLLLLSLCLSCLFFTLACASQGTKNTETAASVDTKGSTQVIACESIDAATLQDLAQRVTWPEEPNSQDKTNAKYTIESGVDGGVWVEGKGYFKMTIQDAYRHFTDPQVIGPLHMTKTFDRVDFTENDGCASFLLKVKMRYILSIAFDLSHHIQPITKDGKAIGFVMKVHKSAGTSHIKEINNLFIVKKIDEDYISIEAQSLNKATMNKPDETREAISGLFERLKEKSTETTTKEA